MQTNGRGSDELDDLAEGGEEYDKFERLDELETLLEEMEEAGIIGLDAGASVPEDMREEMVRLGVRDVQGLRTAIMHLHAELDNDSDDLTISES